MHFGLETGLQRWIIWQIIILPTPCTFHTPLCTYSHSIFWACHPYPTFIQPQTPLATLGNSALVQSRHSTHPGPLWIQVQTLWPSCHPPILCGPTQPTQPSKDLVQPGQHCQSSTLFHHSKPCSRPAYYSSHGPWMVVFFLLGKTLIVIPRGLQGLSPKGRIGVLGYPCLHTDTLLGCPLPQIQNLHYNATPSWPLSLLVTGAQEHLLTCWCFPPSTVSPKGMQSGVGWVGVLVGWVMVLGELGMCVG